MKAVRLFIEDCHGTGTRVDGMAHSLRYQIGESAHAIESEVGKLLNLAATLRDAGDEDLAAAVSTQVNKLLQAVAALRIALAD